MKWPLRALADIEAEIRALTRDDQKRLLRALLEELDAKQWFDPAIVR